MSALKNDINASKEEYKSLWKDDFKAFDKTGARIDKVGDRITKAIYLTALIQYVATVVSIACIFRFMLHK